MLDSYLPTFSLTVIYLLSIWLGNKCMKNRPALSLRSILTLYNLGITLLSMYMLVEVSARAPNLPLSHHLPHHWEVFKGKHTQHPIAALVLGLLFQVPGICSAPDSAPTKSP